jgi:thiamine-monophosphate kinase
MNLEFALIEKLQAILGKPSPRVIVGIGDDAAILQPPTGKLIATLDAMVEGVHFDLSFCTPQELGHKALAVNLSDIAAMGGEPTAALVSLGLRKEIPDSFVEEVYRGLHAEARSHGVDIVGGNVTGAREISIAITLLGQVQGKWLSRAGATVGNKVAVTGFLGASAAGLKGFKRLGKDALAAHHEVVQAHLLPQPRLAEGRALAETATSAIDISDGLANELFHLAEASKVGFLVDVKSLPISAATRKMAGLVGEDAVEWALQGGEDYELLFTFDPARQPELEKRFSALKSSFSVIGEVRPANERVMLKTAEGKTKPLVAKGWDHRAKR